MAEYNTYRTCLDSLDFARDVLETEADDDLRTLAKEDLEKLEPQKEELEIRIRDLLIPKDPQDEKNAIITRRRRRKSA